MSTPILRSILRQAESAPTLAEALRDSGEALESVVAILSDFRTAKDFDARLDAWLTRYAFSPDKARAALAKAESL